MKIKFSLKSLALVGAALAGAWSGSATACAAEPIMGSLCVMAWNRTNSFNGQFMLAAGQSLNVSQNAALFSLLGTTYGGDGRNNFLLPDLRGRVLVGAGTNTNTALGTYNVGQTGGNVSVALSNSQLPAHNHGVAGITAVANLANVKADTTLTGLSATASLNGVTATAKGSDLTFNVSSGPNADTSVPSATTLIGPTAVTTKIYSSTSTGTMAISNKSIGGTASVTFSGNPTVSISGTPSTTLTGVPTVTLSGATAPSGNGTPVDVRQPYLAMYYYIATQGIYPSID